jgi:hypothetical protein
VLYTPPYTALSDSFLIIKIVGYLLSLKSFIFFDSLFGFRLSIFTAYIPLIAYFLVVSTFFELYIYLWQTNYDNFFGFLMRETEAFISYLSKMFFAYALYPILAILLAPSSVSPLSALSFPIDVFTMVSILSAWWIEYAIFKYMSTYSSVFILILPSIALASNAVLFLGKQLTARNYLELDLSEQAF